MYFFLIFSILSLVKLSYSTQYWYLSISLSQCSYSIFSLWNTCVLFSPLTNNSRIKNSETKITPTSWATQMVDEVLTNWWKLKRNAGNISKNINMDYMQAATEIVKVFIQKPSPSPGELLNQCLYSLSYPNNIIIASLLQQGRQAGLRCIWCSKTLQHSWRKRDIILNSP